MTIGRFLFWQEMKLEKVTNRLHDQPGKQMGWVWTQCNPPQNPFPLPLSWFENSTWFALTWPSQLGMSDQRVEWVKWVGPSPHNNDLSSRISKFLYDAHIYRVSGWLFHASTLILEQNLAKEILAFDPCLASCIHFIQNKFMIHLLSNFSKQPVENLA